MAMFFNSVTNRYEDDGQSLPQAAPVLNIPMGRMTAPSGANDVQIPLGYAQNQMRNAAASRDLAIDMQANPQKYPFGNAFTVDTSPETLAAYKQAQAAQAPSSDKLNALPGVAKSDLVGIGGQQQQQSSMAGFKPSDLDKQINRMIAPALAGQNEKMNAASQIMQAAALQGIATGEYYRNAQEINQKVDSDFQEQITAKKQQYQEQADKVSQIANKVSEAAQINPNRFWAEKDTGDKVAAAIAIGLGALGSALQGTGKNAALDILDRAVDKDIMAQEKALMQDKDSLAVQQSLLGMYHQQIGDIQASKMLAKADLMNNAQYALNAQLAGVQSKEALAKGLMMQGQLKQEAGQLRMAAQQQMAQKIQQQNVYSGQSLNPAALPKEQQDQLVKIGNEYRLAISPAAANEIREVSSAVDAFGTEVDRAMSLIKTLKPGEQKLPSEKASQLKTIFGHIGLKYAKTNKMGSYDNGTAELIEKVIGDPSALWTSNVEAKLRQALTGLQSDRQALYENSVFGYRKLK